MAVLGREGDTKSIWNPDVQVEVDAAKKQFDFLVKEKKYSAFRVDKDGKQTGQRMTDFDPKAGSIILVPQFAGG